MMRSSVSISQRFLALTVLGYLLAVGAAAVAVSFGSAATLKDLQDKTIRDHALANSQAVQITLRELALKTKLLAQNPDVVNLTIGDHTNIDRVKDALDQFDSVDGLLTAYLHDFESREVLRHEYNVERKSSFQGFSRSEVARAILSADGPEFVFRFRPGDGPADNRFLIAQPIRQNGFVEGVLIAEFSINIATLFARKVSIGSVDLATPFQHSMLSTWLDDFEAYAAKVEGANFYVVLHPDRAAVSAAGDKIVNSVMYSLGFFLVLPFGMMSLAGLRSIVAPHRALQVSQNALKENQKKLSELADIAQRSNDAIIATDLDGRITWVNQAFVSSTGFDAPEVMGKTPGAVLQGPETDPVERARIAKSLAARKPIRSEILNYCKDGKPYWNAVSISPQFDERGNAYRFVAVSSDITEKRRAQDEIVRAKNAIEFQANHDALTGLPNRRALDFALDQIKKDKTDRVLVRIDLDHFKNVNDTLGHAAGDHVLEIVSKILLKHVRKTDMAARVGGDEFVVLMGEGITHEDATALAERLLSDIQKEITFDDKICRIGASFGVASASSGLLTNSELLLGADSALYEAKRLGRNQVVSYTADLHQNVVASRDIAKEIERAIMNKEFEPFFQPQFDAKTFEFKGMEALVRWRHPDRGILPPAAFLQIAEQLSIANDLDAIVLEKGLEVANRLNKSGFFIPKVSFNVVASRLEVPDIPKTAHLLALEGTRISFEVLESVLIEEQSDLFEEHVGILRDIGFGIEVDDFGSGHASIIGLTKLMPDTMKIDQRLVFPVCDSPIAQKMVRAVVDIGKALEIAVTAEGVETSEHARLLAEAGCSTLQGYYFARPMSGDDLISFLSNYDAEETRRQCGHGNGMEKEAG